MSDFRAVSNLLRVPSSNLRELSPLWAARCRLAPFSPLRDV